MIIHSDIVRHSIRCSCRRSTCDSITETGDGIFVASVCLPVMEQAVPPFVVPRTALSIVCRSSRGIAATHPRRAQVPGHGIGIVLTVHSHVLRCAVQASIAANTYVVSGASQERSTPLPPLWHTSLALRLPCSAVGVHSLLSCLLDACKLDSWALLQPAQSAGVRGCLLLTFNPSTS